MGAWSDIVATGGIFGQDVNVRNLAVAYGSGCLVIHSSSSFVFVINFFQKKMKKFSSFCSLRSGGGSSLT